MLVSGTSPLATIVVAPLFSSISGRGFLLSEGTFSTIDVPGASFTEAFGINPKGNIVGSHLSATGLHGFLLSGGAFNTIDVPGASFPEASGINAKCNTV